MRPRNLLLDACTWLSREEASEALRNAGGDVEKAKRAASAFRRRCQAQDETDVGGRGPATVTTDAALAEGCSTTDDSDAQNDNDNNNNNNNTSSSPLAIRAPPRHSASINNLSDRQYCCVWSVEVYEDGYRPDFARTLLATVARHVNPILRDRGWRVKRLIESASTQWIGLCTTNGRSDADAASTNIQLNLRVRPDRHCKQFRTFHQILAVMLHEITHTSIGLEDIHPPAFYELLDQIKVEYREKLAAGEVDLEADDYGCNRQFIRSSGELSSVAASATDVLGISHGLNQLDLLGNVGSEGDCGASKKRRRRGYRKRNRKNYNAGYTSNVAKKKKIPLLKGSKMVDKRTKIGKAAMAERENLTARELAAKAALARFGCTSNASSFAARSSVQDLTCDSSSSSDDEKNPSTIRSGESSCDEEEEDKDCIDERIEEHDDKCACRSCDWSKLFLLE